MKITTTDQFAAATGFASRFDVTAWAKDGSILGAMTVTATDKARARWLGMVDMHDLADCETFDRFDVAAA